MNRDEQEIKKEMEPEKDRPLSAPALVYPDKATRDAALAKYRPMLPLTEEERAALRDSIRRHGIKSPVEIDEHANVLDGHEVYRISAERGIACPFVVVADLTETEKLLYAARSNLARRQAGPLQRGYVLLMLRDALGIAAGRGGDRRSTASVARGSITELAAMFGWPRRSATRWMRLAEPFLGDPEAASAVDERLRPRRKAVARARRARRMALGLKVRRGFGATPIEIGAAYHQLLGTYFELVAFVRAHRSAMLRELGRRRAARLPDEDFSDEEIVVCGMLEALEYAGFAKTLAETLEYSVHEAGGHARMWEVIRASKRKPAA